jgi:hypothetical protein
MNQTRTLILLTVLLATNIIHADQPLVLDINKDGLANEYMSIKEMPVDGLFDLKDVGGKKAVAGRNETNWLQASYLYLDVNDKYINNVNRDLYLVIEYYNTKTGVIDVEYDSNMVEYTQSGAYTPAKETYNNLLYNTDKYDTAVFYLPSAKFSNRENGGTDFRLVSGRLIITRIEVWFDKPAELISRLSQDPARFDGMIKFSMPRQQVIFGGSDWHLLCAGKINMSEIDAADRKLGNMLPLFKGLGATSVETYVKWNLVETEKEKFDFRAYDGIVDACIKNNVNWVPFLIIGPAYALPDWFYKSADHVGYVCLEHGKECDIVSLWNPAMAVYVDKFMEQFAAHYLAKNVIESVLLGITGTYGEAIYPFCPGTMAEGDWTAAVHGDYHSHQGFWCGDKYAIENFRSYLKQKYVDVQTLNRAWKSKFNDFPEIKPLLQSDAPSDTAYLDMVDWYRKSMTDWSEYWLKTARKHFPGMEINLCTGGDAIPEHGSNFAQQCAVSAKHNAGVRITNEANPFARNFTLTNWVAAAAKFYGIKFGFEPAGWYSSRGIVTRIYNAVTSGADSIHTYVFNLFTFDTHGEWFKYAGLLTTGKPVCDVCVFYPETELTLKQTETVDSFLLKIEVARDVTNLDMVDESLITDGVLTKYKILVVFDNERLSPETQDKIVDWCSTKNGIVITNKNLLKYPAFSQKFSNQKKVGKATVYTFGPSQLMIYKTSNITTFFRFVDTLTSTPGLDAEQDNVYATVMQDGDILYLNDNPDTVNKTVTINGNKQTVTLDPYSIKTVNQ